MGRLMNIAMMRSSSMLEFLYPPHLNFWSVPARRVWRALRTCLCSGCFRSSYFFFIAIIRLRYHQPTKDYAARKTCGAQAMASPNSRSARHYACRPAASARLNEANGTCPNSSDGPSNGFTPSPVQNNTPKHLTMYRSI